MIVNEIHTLNGRSVAEVLQDFKNEFATAFATRLAMLREEMKQKTTAIKASIPMIVAGLLFLVTAWFLLTGLIVSAIAQALAGNPWAYTIAFGAAMLLYAIVGGILAMLGINALKKHSLKPERTLQVLQDDKIWLQTEARRVQA